MILDKPSGRHNCPNWEREVFMGGEKMKISR